MLLVLAAALAWCGTGGQVAIGAALVVALAMLFVGMTPYVADVFLFAFFTLATGGAGLTTYLRSLDRSTGFIPRATWLKVVLPLTAVLGDLAPSVQISVHPIDTGGILALHPLVQCGDETIREGIRALLTERALQGDETERRRASQNWTNFQIADRMLVEKLHAHQSDWSD